MTEKIVLLNGSRKLDCNIPLEAIAEIGRLRQVELEHPDCHDFLRTFIDIAYNPKRRQVNIDKLTQALNLTKELQDRYEAGKIIILDEDIFPESGDCDWVFGSSAKFPNSLGFITISTARVKGENMAGDIISHELGHMFGAPSRGRENTYELFGLHCSNDLCVMQQKDSVAKAVKYASERAKARAQTYCKQCEEDIKNSKVTST